jgi:predicted  nucleic acid-binding Zn-ribbon protein
VQTLKKRQIALEEIELEIMIRNDAITARQNTLATDLASLEKLKAEINQRLTAATGEINSLVVTKKSAREILVSKIEKPLIDLYEKIRASGGGIGASALVGNKCNGCNLAINAVEVERIKTLPKDEVLRCEECRRILVRI